MRRIMRCDGCRMMVNGFVHNGEAMTYRTVTALGFGVTFCLALGVHSEPPRKLLEAKSEYQRSIEKAEASYTESVRRAAADYLQKLFPLLDQETKAGKLDGALLVREEIRSIETQGAQNIAVRTKSDLKRVI